MTEKNCGGTDKHMFSFRILKKLGDARLTELTTPHGKIPGPFFQFVATQGAIKGMVLSEDLAKMDVDIVLANTYHLHLRPGEETVAHAGGLHGFMQWDKPITTDSGGYQVFSLGEHRKLDADSVTFKSPLDGSMHRLTPETTMQIEEKLGADIIMPLDVCTPYGASHDKVAQAVNQTTEWAKRCLAEHVALQAQGVVSVSPPAVPAIASSRRLDKGDQGGLLNARNPSSPPLIRGGTQRQALYGIVQGSVYPDLREKSAAALRELDFFGYSIGGELRDIENSEMESGVQMTVPHLPPDKPRYLMGSGTPEDIVRAVRSGVDQFDCVLPTRNARHGKIYRELNHEELTKCLQDPERPVDHTQLYTAIDIRKSRHAHDFSIFAPGHPVLTAAYSVAYVHHLFRAEEPSGMRFAVLQNIHFYIQLMRAIQATIDKYGK